MTATMCHERGEAHDYAPTPTRGRFTGEPSRPRRKCPAVTLDPLHDVDTWREEDGYHLSCACGHFAGPFPTEAGAVEAADGPHP